ncbi:hypothetical protein [Plantactinospora sp. KBS50]|nr:hypothetical protein [Plantactinospora sp. KBS50]
MVYFAAFDICHLAEPAAAGEIGAALAAAVHARARATPASCSPGCI